MIERKVARRPRKRHQQNAGVDDGHNDARKVDELFTAKGDLSLGHKKGSSKRRRSVGPVKGGRHRSTLLSFPSDNFTMCLIIVLLLQGVRKIVSEK